MFLQEKTSPGIANDAMTLIRLADKVETDTLERMRLLTMSFMLLKQELEKLHTSARDKADLLEVFDKYIALTELQSTLQMWNDVNDKYHKFLFKEDKS